MSHVPLQEAIGLLAPNAGESNSKFERASARWLARLTLEKPELTLAEVQFAAGALLALPTREATPIRVLEELAL